MITVFEPFCHRCSILVMYNIMFSEFADFVANFAMLYCILVCTGYRFKMGQEVLQQYAAKWVIYFAAKCSKMGQVVSAGTCPRKKNVTFMSSTHF